MYIYIYIYIFCTRNTYPHESCPSVLGHLDPRRPCQALPYIHPSHETSPQVKDSKEKKPATCLGTLFFIGSQRERERETKNLGEKLLKQTAPCHV